MINHVRTLLINRKLPNKSQYGSEYTDPSFNPIVLTPHSQTIHETLFGSDPDELTLNYRAAQYLNLLYSDPEAKKFLDKIDPRNTYRNDVWYNFDFSSKMIVTGDSLLALNVELLGIYIGQDAFGQNLLNCEMILDYTAVSPTLTFIYKNHNLQNRVIAMNTDDAQIITNQDIPGLLFALTDVSDFVGDVFVDNLEVRSEPSRSIGEIASTLIRAGAMNFDFDIDPELAKEFEMLSKYRTNSLQKLTGILLSYIHENEKVRVNGQSI